MYNPRAYDWTQELPNVDDNIHLPNFNDIRSTDCMDNTEASDIRALTLQSNGTTGKKIYQA